MRRVRRLGVAALLLVAACSLARRTPSVSYFVLAPAPPAAGSLPVTVQVGPFSADPAYAGSRMAFRTSTYRIEYSTYHRWASPPRSLVESALRDWFAVASEGTRGPAVEVDGMVQRLEAVEESGGGRASLLLFLRARRGGTVVVEGSYAEDEPAKGGDAEAAAAALSRALDRALQRFAADLTRAASRADETR